MLTRCEYTDYFSGNWGFTAILGWAGDDTCLMKAICFNVPRINCILPTTMCGGERWVGNCLLGKFGITGTCLHSLCQVQSCLSSPFFCLSNTITHTGRQMGRECVSIPLHTQRIPARKQFCPHHPAPRQRRREIFLDVQMTLVRQHQFVTNSGDLSNGDSF